ncbi:MAG: 2-oxo-4-hydroxy-4-carboxy-5-ureidoimidazoline decarboxylase [Chloroflexota bacterium]|nr:2-oxo-4-hydroxy-4-carboxy-5-ureidoimidazoline decarboxylase [Chloroflexota bacterium]
MSRIAVAEAFERAPLLAERVGEGGDADAVIARARAALAAMTETERIAVLDAHPRIGATAGLSTRSAAEQSAGATDGGTLDALARLNDAYERRFGFRFVVFVRGRTRADIVPVLDARLGRSRDEELATGLEEFLAIARDRMERG